MKQSQQKVESIINNPKLYVQASAGVWPNDYKFRDQLSMPLTLAIRPIELDDDIHPASFSSNKINDYRCHSCKAFLNKYCTIRSKFQYDCSICGCTNRLSHQIDSLAVQMVSPVYSCLSSNPLHRVNQSKTRTIVFVIDLTEYGVETQIIVRYVVQIVRDFMKQIQEQLKQKEQQKGNKEPFQIQTLIFGFDDRIHQYRIISDILPLQQKSKNKNEDGQNNRQGGFNPKQNFQIEKVVDTHLSNSNEDLFIYDHQNNYYIQLPKHNDLVQSILSDLLSTTNNQNAGEYGFASNALLPALQRALQYSKGCVGKIFVISGYRSPENQFVDIIQEEPQQLKSNFNVNKQKCLNETLVYLVERTQMSVSFFIYNNAFINVMPLFSISKLTNGELKLYNSNQFEQFYYQLHYAVCTESFQLGTQSILKVRHSSGVKLVSIFGQFRNYKGGSDQIQLLSCPENRIYVFEFSIEGKVQQPYVNIQFSILWTDGEGNRIFKILTYCQKLSNNREQILGSINYGVVNQSYLWAIIYNMDLNTKIKTLQLTLQERCRKHIKAIQKFSQNKENIKRATPYIMFTYYLMRHFIMNTRYTQSVLYDKSIEARSRIITGDISGIHTIWPAVYIVGNSQDQIKIVEMRYEQIKDAKLAVVVDQGDYCYVHILPPKIRKQVNKDKLNLNKKVFDIINEKPELKNLSQFLKQIKQEKQIGYLQINLMETLQGICILDQKGPLSYANFISMIAS